MPIYRLQAAFTHGTIDQRDNFVITPHFENTASLQFGAGDGLCQDLADGLASVFGFVGQIKVKAYDAQGSKPVYPVGEAVKNPGVIGAQAGPRELAVCFSFFSQHNRPRRRGRLYIPAVLAGVATNTQRPAVASQQTMFGNLASLFSGLGGPNIDWVVFSRRDNAAYKVSNWWVDNEWDVQRSRGLRPTDRIAGTTSG